MFEQINNIFTQLTDFFGGFKSIFEGLGKVAGVINEWVNGKADK